MGFNEEERTKSGKKKLFVIILLVMIVLLMISVQRFDSSNKRFTSHGHTFTYSENDGVIYRFYDESDNELIVTVAEDKHRDFRDLSVDYGGEVVELKMKDFYSSRELYINGEFVKTVDKFEVLGRNQKPREKLFEEELMINIEEIVIYVNDLTLKVLVIGEISLIILGAAIITVPEVFWKLKYAYVVNDGEPTDLSIGIIRFSGIMLCIVSVLFHYTVIF